jgi:Uma2 family endonuclease
MATVPQTMTLEAFLELPEEKPALEYINGKVTQKVSPQGKHSTLQGWLVTTINLFAKPLQLAEAFPELRFNYAGHSYVPDVTVYRWDRIPIDGAGEIANVFRVPPDIAIEIISPDQSANALFERCLWYVTNGAQISLLVDPSHKSILDCRPGEIPIVHHRPDRIDLSPVLPGFVLNVQEVFDALRRSGR